MDNTDKLILNLIQKRSKVSITELMKLCYLIDYVLTQKRKERVTEFKYERYLYGPFDKSIYIKIEKLIETGFVTSKSEYSDTGRDYIVYSLADESQELENYLVDFNNNGIDVIKGVVSELSSCNAKLLTQIAYKTPPIKSLGAEIGNNLGIGVILDLNTK